MRTITEMNLPVRTRTELPSGLKLALATDELREDWKFLQLEDAEQLDKKMRTSGWNLVKISDGLPKCGIGDTSQEAIATALKRALRLIVEPIVAVEVGSIRLTRYPWFCIAIVTVFAYWIRESSAYPVPDRITFLAPSPHRGRPRLQADVLDPQFASVLLHLRQMLISSQVLQNELRGYHCEQR